MKYQLFVLFAIIIGFSSCEMLNEYDDSPVQSTILSFESNDELISYTNQALSANLTELQTIEMAEGFNSFGKKADELYKQAIDANFSSKKELETFVNKHSEYLQFVTDGDGEVSFETRLYSSPFRYVINEDRIYQINNTAIKVFENGHAITSLDKLDLLRQETGLNFRKTDNQEVQFIDFNKLNNANLNTGRTTEICDNNEVIEQSGNYRTRLELSAKYSATYSNDKSSINNPVFDIVVFSYHKVRSQHRVFGIWFASSRTISGEINTKVYFDTPNFGLNYGTAHDSRSGGDDSKWEGLITAGLTTHNSASNCSYGLLGYYAWAKVGSNPVAILSCNVDAACENGCTPPPSDPCDDVTCPAGYVCENGNCILDNSSCNEPCPIGTTCVNGECVPDMQ